MDQIAMLAASLEAWAALAMLIVLEVVLGIDNLIFISILTNRLPEADRPRARMVGISAALVLRLALLSLIFVIMGLTAPVFTVLEHAFSWRDLILIAGGLFLVWKATTEIYHNVDPNEGAHKGPTKSVGFAMVIGYILILYLVFSMDSILTAVGMTPHLPIMVTAVVVSVVLMMVAARPLVDFIHANPTVVMLALGFLLMIGMVLIADGFGAHVPKGYIYAAIAFSALVEGLNMLARKARARRRAAEQGMTD